MNISIQQLLMKMEDQLKDARSSNSDARIRERVYAIKSLCELVLDQDGRMEENIFQQPSYPVTQTPINMVAQPMQTTQTTQTKKLNTDEGNGDSLFDF